MIDIKSIDKAKLLAALYNASQVQGLGFLHATDTDLSLEEAQQLLTESTYFDYLHGKVLKIDLAGDTLDPQLYDRDNGAGAALQVVNSVLDKMTQ